MERGKAGLVAHPPPGTGACPLHPGPTHTDEHRVGAAADMPPHDKGNMTLPDMGNAQGCRHPRQQPIGHPIPMTMAMAMRTDDDMTMTKD